MTAELLGVNGWSQPKSLAGTAALFCQGNAA
jgi:hypothetical protein